MHVESYATHSGYVRHVSFTSGPLRGEGGEEILREEILSDVVLDAKEMRSKGKRSENVLPCMTKISRSNKGFQALH